MKVSYSEQTVSIDASFTFAEMATLEDLLQTAMLEAVESSSVEKQGELICLSNRFGIDIQVELCGMTSEIAPESETPAIDMGNSQAGQDSDVISS